MAANAGANNCSPTSSAAARQLSRSKLIALVIGLGRWISEHLHMMANQKEGAKRLRVHLDTPTGARVSEPQHPRTIRSAAGRRPALRTIPKGLGPPAQGCRAT